MFVSTTTGQCSMLGMGNNALWLQSVYNFYLFMLLLAFILPFGFIITIKSANSFIFILITMIWWNWKVNYFLLTFYLEYASYFFHTDLLLAIFAIFVYNWEFQFLGVIQVSACCTKTVLISNTALTFYHYPMPLSLLNKERKDFRGGIIIMLFWFSLFHFLLIVHVRATYRCEIYT